MTGKNSNKRAPRKAQRPSGRNRAGGASGKALRAMGRDLMAGIGTLFWIIGQALSPVTRPLGNRLKQRETWKVATLHASSVGFAGVIGFMFVSLWVSRDVVPPADADLWTVNRPTSITFLDRDGDVIGSRGSYYGDPVPVEELPDYVVAAFVSTEDRRFFNHFGFDARGFARAILTNIRRGRLAEGGSTISQQLARNLFLSNERTLTRKMQELNLAFWLEARLTKEEILSLYLNRTYLGAGTYGIEAASQHYFSKSARDLSLSEAALLAGLPKAPSALAPTTNFTGAELRAREVIGNLVETGAITREEAETARKLPPELIVVDNNPDFGYFFDHVMIEVATLLPALDTDIVVETTIDTDLQRDGQQVLRAAMTDEVKGLGAEQAALIAYDNDGALLTMIGGLSYEDSQFNRATQAERQPGSTFKPFVYLAALEAGMTPGTMFIDQPIIVDNWQPKNYSGEFDGPMRMTEALARSVNTVAVQTMESIGRQRVINTAREMGIHHTMQPVPSIALGTTSVTLDEITSAYLPFARGGLSASPYAIRRIENRRGEVLYEREPQQQHQIFDEERSRQMNFLLHQVMVNGTGTRASLGSRQSAGKTGTTDDWRDAWFVGYTGQITAGVWVGNDANRPMQKVTGGSVPASIWKGFMLAAHEDLPPVALPGSDRLPSSTSTIRLARFYDALQSDLAAIAYGRNAVTAWDTAPRAGDNGRVVGRAWNEPAERQEPPREEPREDRRRRGWWPFGRN